MRFLPVLLVALLSTLAEIPVVCTGPPRLPHLPCRANTTGSLRLPAARARIGPKAIWGRAPVLGRGQLRAISMMVVQIVDPAMGAMVWGLMGPVHFPGELLALR